MKTQQKKQLKEFAEKLNGTEYTELPGELIDYAKQNGIVIVSGASDDLCELDGAIVEEFGCYDGGTAYISEEGVVYSEKKVDIPCKYITAKWCEDGDDGFTWTYETDIPHEDFEMFDGEEKYCKGFVFYLESLKAKNGDFLKLVRDNPDLPIVAMVDNEVCGGDDYGWWLGSFGRAEVTEYTVAAMDDGRVITRGNQDEAEEYFANKILDENPELSDDEVEKRAHEEVEALPWVKAIMVWIGLPGEDE